MRLSLNEVWNMLGIPKSHKKEVPNHGLEPLMDVDGR
jgi:hypothetical protein